jgi:hypothetical protein
VVARFSPERTEDVNSIHVVTENDETSGNRWTRAHHINDGEYGKEHLKRSVSNRRMRSERVPEQHHT